MISKYDDAAESWKRKDERAAPVPGDQERAARLAHEMYWQGRSEAEIRAAQDAAVRRWRAARAARRLKHAG